MHRSELSDRRLAAFASLGLLSVFAVALVFVRVAYTGRSEGLYLVWNLFLAWVPFVLAVLVYDGARRGVSRTLVAAEGVLWLLFFPNAPYIVTDFTHLEGLAGAPEWFDIVVLTAFAWSGLLLGLLSLYLVHSVARRAVGALNAWALVLAVLGLSSFGIFLGRFQRWNSWDVFTSPQTLLADAVSHATDVRTVSVTVLFTGFLTASYFVVYSFMRLAALEPADRG
jgi:uncharacterized membrane protein